MSRVIIAGTRTCEDYFLVETAIAQSRFNVTAVVSGRSRGVDRLGERWAQERNIPITYFPAQWNCFGLAAGYLRNEEMGDYADALVAVWDGKSKGTKHMIDIMRKLGKAAVVLRYE